MSTLTLVLTAVGSVLLLLFLVMKARMHAFVALMVVSIGAGLFSGMPLDKIAATMEKGMGGTLEKESRTLAQRLSVLHGINAPEFFDKAVFSSLVLTLRDEGFISDTGDAEPEETLKVYQMLAELITSDVRLTIESATQGE